MTPSVVRIAREGDRAEVWRLLLQAFRENGQFTLKAEKVDWFVSRALQPHLIPEWDMGARPIIAVIGFPGALEALLLMSIDQYWYTDEKHLAEYLVYVDPECRRSNHAKATVEWMKHQSDITGLPLLTGVISNERTEAKVRLYRRLVPYIGAFFLYRGGKNADSSSLAA